MKETFSFSFLRSCLLSLCLMWTQLAWSVADAPKNNSAEKVQAAQDNATKAQEHDQKAYAEGAPNATNCRSLNDGTADNLNQMINFEQMYMDQNLDGIRAQQERLNQLTGNMNGVQGSINENAGADGMSSMPAEQVMELQQRADEAKQKKDEAKAKLDELGHGRCNNIRFNSFYCSSVVQAKEATYRNAYARCYDYDINSPYTCTPDERARVESTYNDWQETKRAYNQALADYRYYSNELQRIGRQMPRNQIHSAANESGDSMADADATQTQSNNISGINPATGELTGPLKETYDNMTQMYNNTMESAKNLAEAQAEKLTAMELQNAYNGDYRLYEMALDNFGVDQAIANVNANSNFSGARLARSNLKVMSAAGAAVKDLKCEKDPISEADSKAYYMFKAAAATYLMAEINDTSYYSNTSDCRTYETFNDDTYANGEFYDPACKTMSPTDPDYGIKCQKKHKDMQTLSVERATNLYTEVFEGLCLRIDPADSALKEECNNYLDTILGNVMKDEDGNHIRSRDVALNMFEKALEAAMLELTNKVEKVSTAHANVKKGESWVARDQTSLAIAIALSLIFKALGITLTSICPTLYGSWACGPAANAWSSFSIWDATAIYYAADLIKANNYLAKWRRKRDVARHYTHLKCNQNEAFAEVDAIAEIANKAQERAREEVRKRKLDILNELGVESEDQLRAPTSYIPDPDLYKRIVGNLNHAQSDLEANLLVNDLIRSTKGATRSLPYYAALPLPQEIDLKLKGLGLNLVKKFETGAEALVNFFAPTAKAELTSALGMGNGSASFAYFLTSRNKMWQDQALDVTERSERITNPVNFMSTTDGYVIRITYDSNGNARSTSLSQENLTGFPLPDTRVVTIQNMINMIRDNMSLMDMGIAELAAQRDAYATLLDRMKRRMTLDKKGVTSIDAEAEVIPAGRCMRVGSDGDFEIDEKCECRASNSCGNFSYPNLGDYLGGNQTGDGNVVQAANSFASGNLAGGSVAGASLTKNATRVRKNIEKYRKDLKEKTGRDIVSESRAQNYASSATVDRIYKKNNPALSSYESKKGLFKARGNSNDPSLLAAKKNAKDAKAKTKPASKGKNLAKNGSKSAKKAKGSDDELEFMFDDDGDYSGGAMAALGKMDGEGEDNQADDEGQSYGHQRRIKRYKAKGGFGNEVNKNRKKNIFGIISNRYKKTAFPILLRKRKSVNLQSKLEIKTN